MGSRFLKTRMWTTSTLDQSWMINCCFKRTKGKWGKRKTGEKHNDPLLSCFYWISPAFLPMCHGLETFPWKIKNVLTKLWLSDLIGKSQLNLWVELSLYSVSVYAQLSSAESISSLAQQIPAHSGWWFRAPRCKTKQHRKAVAPEAVALLNKVTLEITAKLHSLHF